MTSPKDKDHRGIYGANPHYEFRDRDPVFDHMSNIVKASGMSLAEIAYRTHMSPSTMSNWFVRHKTIAPRHDSVQIFYRSFGIDYGAQSTLRVVVSKAKNVGRLVHIEKKAAKKDATG